MKHIASVLISITVFLLPLISMAADNNPWERKLPFDKATVLYTLSGTEKGTEAMYIRDYGKETATYHKGVNTIMGRAIQTDTVRITTPAWIYTFDLLKKTGKKSVNPQKYMIEEYNILSSAEKDRVMKNAREMGVTMAGGMGGKLEVNAEKILGYDCDRATIMGSTIYSIHETGIPLKVDTAVMGISMQKVATEVNKGSADAKFFEFPAGITPQPDPEGDAMARSMAPQILAMLKDPDSAKKTGPMNPILQKRAGKNTPQDGDSEVSDEEMEQAMKAMQGTPHK